MYICLSVFLSVSNKQFKQLNRTGGFTDGQNWKVTTACSKCCTLKVSPHVYHSRYNPSAMNLKQNTIHTASILWTINVTTTGHDLVCYQPHNSDLLINVSNRTRSMNFQRHYTGRDLICYVNQTIVMYWTMPLLNSYVST